jgi:hypothetical protein
MVISDGQKHSMKRFLSLSPKMSINNSSSRQINLQAIGVLNQQSNTVLDHSEKSNENLVLNNSNALFTNMNNTGPSLLGKLPKINTSAYTRKTRNGRAQSFQ